MLDKILYVGSLDSESLWRDTSYSKLPAVHDEQRSRIVMAMDELMFPFCSHRDGLFTRFPMEDSHKAYLHQLGFSFDHRSCEDASEREDMFCTLTTNTNLKTWIASFNKLSPYSVLERTQELQKCHFTIFPSYETVRLVNSKMYSAELSKRLTGSNESYPVHSADELQNVCQTILFKHKALLIKDPFGVSGKGNIKIDSISAVKRLVQYIQRQEQRGANTAFIVEPFFDVERDFSCQFHLEPDGSFRFISMQQMLNHHLAYLGSYSMAKEAVHELENRGYFKVMENIGSALYEQGYFGPVCVDSMQLTNGTLIPIVEINARKSMGLINHYLDGLLATDHRQGFLTFLSLGYRNHFDYEAMLQDMERAKLLFTPLQGDGIVPLSSATLLVNELYRDRDVSMGTEEEPLLKGRLYLSVFAKDVEVRMRLLSGMRVLLASQGVSVYD